MAIRLTMTALVARVAALAADPTFLVFTPDDAQAALDRYRTEYTLWPLVEQVSVNPTTHAYEWLHYYMGGAGGAGGAVLGDWEGGGLLQANVYTDITTDPGTTIDYAAGRVTFAATRYPPVWWTGTTYDVYAAAADLCDDRAAAAAGAVDVREDRAGGGGLELKRSQIRSGWREQAAIYRRRARVRTSLLVRSDGRP